MDAGHGYATSETKRFEKRMTFCFSFLFVFGFFSSNYIRLWIQALNSWSALTLHNIIFWGISLL